ncbi:MAG: NifB/NifX family molybdenum-iron cluster-binding protein [Candidatus Electryoneaceae bacterium]|nr:NifB/NifX family molybdenum-iron cluster-binding protein [Candidatus Electryoneaceae bacterium]
MKNILVTATVPNLDAKVHKRFGGAEYYLIVDPETMEFTVIEGKGEDHPSHGISRFINHGIGSVIAGNIGPNAFDDLMKAGWSAYSCHGMVVREAVEKVKNGEVSPLTKPTMRVSVHSARGVGGGHHTGGGRGSGKNRGAGRKGGGNR